MYPVINHYLRNYNDSNRTWYAFNRCGKPTSEFMKLENITKDMIWKEKKDWWLVSIQLFLMYKNMYSNTNEAPQGTIHVIRKTFSNVLIIC